MKNKEVISTPPLASKINRNFYRSLRSRGRTHNEIISMIQPERREQFLKDSHYIAQYLEQVYDSTPPSSWWDTLKNKIRGTFKLLFTVVGIGIAVGVSGQVPKSDIVSVVTEKKDTLFLANNPLGCEILDAWAHYPNDRPVIILKSEDWIIREKKRRNKEEDGTK